MQPVTLFISNYYQLISSHSATATATTAAATTTAATTTATTKGRPATTTATTAGSAFALGSSAVDGNRALLQFLAVQACDSRLAFL